MYLEKEVESMCYTKQDIIEMVEEEDVEFIRLQFVDLFGTLKNLAVTTSQLEKVLAGHCKFDAGAIDGFMDENLTELFLRPDLDSFTIFPWRPQQGKVARFLCDVVREDGTPFEGDSRCVLKRVVAKAKELGYELEVGPLCEFFLFDQGENGELTTKSSEMGSYFDLGPIDHGENARREMVLFLEKMGFEVESSFHAAARAQHGIVFKYDNALKTADNILTYKLVIHTAAKRHGFHASFMPKPTYGMDGSGMHLSFFIKKDGKNIFQDGEGGEPSEAAKSFIAGIMEHIEGMSLINNPIINSYKRLVPGYNAPVMVDYAEGSQNALLRFHRGASGNAWVKLRSPDSAANPYLCLAVCLAAGLHGMERKLTLPSGGKDAQKALPPTLEDAIRAFEKDCFIQGILGEYISEKYMEKKKEEWNEYCKQITRWEIEQYLYKI